MSFEPDPISFVERFRNFAARFSTKKLVINRELVQERPVYSRSDLVIFCVSCTLGVNLWRSSLAATMYGASAPSCYIACGFLQLVSFCSYLELTSMQPCLGGAYHFAYNSCGEFIAFLVGWMMIGYLISSTARTFQFGSFLIDHIFFGGSYRQSEQMRFELGEKEGFSLSSFFQPYFNVFPFLLCISFCGIVAAEPNDSKIINIVVFFLASCLLTTLLVVLIGTADFSIWVTNRNTGAVIASFRDVNACLSGVYLLTLFGEDAVRPKQDIPPAMIWSYLITWAGLSSFTTVLLLNGKDSSLDSPTIILDILCASGFSGLQFVPQLGIICAIFSSCFVELYSTVKLFLAMSRDGLIPKAFSKLEHIRRIPVKPTFLTGVIIGLCSTIFKTTFLISAANTFHMCLLIVGPILLMKQRYMSSIIHIENQIRRKRRPNLYCGLAIYVGAIGCFMFGKSIYEPLAIYVFHRDAVTRGPCLTQICIYGIISLSVFVFLCFQPQNHPISKYKFIGVPYVPMAGIIMYGLMNELLPWERIWVVFGWLGLGTVGYCFRLLWT